MRAILLAAAIFIIPGNGALAQDRVLPASYRAMWASPSCDSPQRVLVTSAHFVLSADAHEARIDPLAVRATGDDYIKVEQGGENFFLTLETPDKMTVTALKIRNGIWPERLDPFSPALSVRKFEKCDAVPAAAASWPSTHSDGIAAFAALDRLLRACAAAAMTADCAERLFETADLNHDGLLDYREMAVGWRRINYVAGAAGNGCVFARMFPGTAAADGPAHAASAVRTNDADHDYRLSLAEIAVNPPAILAAAAHSLRRLLPSLPTGGGGLCDNG